MQQDLLTLIDISGHINSFSHIYSRRCNSHTDEVKIRISSAYKTTKLLRPLFRPSTKSSKYRAKRNGERTEPWRTPKQIFKNGEIRQTIINTRPAIRKPEFKQF